MNVKTKASPVSIVRDIKRKTRRKFTAPNKYGALVEAFT